MGSAYRCYHGTSKDVMLVGATSLACTETWDEVLMVRKGVRMIEGISDIMVER